MTAPDTPDAHRAPRDPSALLVGWAAVAIVDTVVLTIRLPARLPIGARAATHFFDGAQLLAMGIVATGIVAAWRRFGPARRWIAWVTLVLASWTVGHNILVEDMSGPASRIPEIVPMPARVAALTLATSLAIPVAALLGGLFAKGWRRAIGVALGLAAAAVNGVIEEQAYTGVHLVTAIAAAVAIGRSLEGAEILAAFAPADVRKRRALSAGLAVAAATSVVAWPSNAALLLLTAHPSAVLVPYLARLRSDEAVASNIPEEQREWFADRSALPPIPPSKPPLLGQEPIVLLIGVDSLRADVLADERNRSKLPELFRLRDESVYFSEARAPGSSTVPSLAAMFSGLYYSQLYWSTLKNRDATLPYPHQDRRQRFPELLASAGVRTCTCDSVGWLTNDYGIVRGFHEQETPRRTGGSVPGARLMTCALTRVKDHGRGPLFVFAHLLDAHSPYTSAGKKDSQFEGYMAELGLVDAQIKRMRAAIAAAHMEERTTIVLISDHGDAFGEHGLTWHAKSLYEELLHVPLMIRVPGVAPRAVADPVSLVDVGPTILDLMGVQTPGRFMGQSLVGFLRGERPKLTRPIVAEARLKRSTLFPNGLKIIHDTRSHAVELFDLESDPQELSNRYADGAADSLERLSVLSTFFRVHTYQKRGYKVPYRRW